MRIRLREGDSARSRFIHCSSTRGTIWLSCRKIQHDFLLSLDNSSLCYCCLSRHVTWRDETWGRTLKPDLIPGDESPLSLRLAVTSPEQKTNVKTRLMNLALSSVFVFVLVEAAEGGRRRNKRLDATAEHRTWAAFVVKVKSWDVFFFLFG